MNGPMRCQKCGKETLFAWHVESLYAGQKRTCTLRCQECHDNVFFLAAGLCLVMRMIRTGDTEMLLKNRQN